jgi:hypothetical protein
METGSVAAIVAALNQHRVRYLVVGGLAVVAHGCLRFTADVDLMLSMDLIEMKTLAGRPRDLEDVENLKRLRRNRDD